MEKHKILFTSYGLEWCPSYSMKDKPEQELFNWKDSTVILRDSYLGGYIKKVN